MKSAVWRHKLFTRLYFKIRPIGLWAVLVAGSGRFAAAQEAFSEPKRISDGAGLAAQTSLGVDLGQNAYVAMVLGSRIVVRVLGTTADYTVPLSDGTLGQGDPVVETNAVGVAYIAFTQEDDEAGAEGREIFLTSNTGGRFREPTNLSRNQMDDSAPRLFIDAVAAAQVAGDADEHLGSLVRRQRLLHRALGGVDRAADFGGARLGNTSDDLAGVGRADLDPLAGLDPLTVDQEPFLGRRDGHVASLGNFTRYDDAEDVRAVMDAVRSERAALLG